MLGGLARYTGLGRTQCIRHLYNRLQARPEYHLYISVKASLYRCFRYYWQPLVDCGFYYHVALRLDLSACPDLPVS